MTKTLRLVVVGTGALLLIIAVILLIVRGGKETPEAEDSPIDAYLETSDGSSQDRPGLDASVSANPGTAGTEPSAAPPSPEESFTPPPAGDPAIDVDDSIYDYDPSEFWWLQEDSPITSKEPILPSLTAEEKNKLIFKNVDENIPGVWVATGGGVITTYEFKKDGTYTLTYAVDPKNSTAAPLPSNEIGTYEVTHTTIEDKYPHAFVFLPADQTQTVTLRFYCYNNKAQTEYYFLIEGYAPLFTRK